MIQNRQCKLCALHIDNPLVCTINKNFETSQVMAVLDMPTDEDAINNSAFDSKAGQYVQRHMTVDFYATTAIKCATSDRKTPSAAIIAKCRTYLEQEIDAVNPEFVLLMGAAAVKAVHGGRASITALRGQFIEINGVTYMATHHPNAVFFDDRLKQAFENDLAKFCKAVKQGVNVAKIDHTIIESVAEFNLMLQEIKNTVVIDIETTGLDPRNGSINMVGIGLEHAQYLLPLNTWLQHKPKLARKIMLALEQAISNEYVILINHNIKFDLIWLHLHFGWTRKAEFDTMLAQHSLDENMISYSLKALSSDLLNAPSYDLTLEEKTGGAPVELLAEYCAKDLYYTRKLYEMYSEQFETDTHAHKIFSYIYMGATNMLIDVEKHGVYIDESQLIKTIHTLRQDAKKQLKELNYLASNQIENWGSNKQVCELFFKKMRIPSGYRTATGAPSVGADALVDMALRGYEIADVLLNYRKTIKLVKDFAEDWAERLKEETRLYPSFSLGRTVTGRTSSSNPNIQQVPKDGRIRSLVTAPEGKMLIECDLSQIELRIIAMYSQDQTMMEVYRNNGDIHTTTAEATARKRKEQMTSEEFKDKRSKAKPVNFGFMYGMGWTKFILYAKTQYGVVFTAQEAKNMRNLYFKTYPGIAYWHEKQRMMVEKKGYVSSPIGRKRRLPNVFLPDDQRKAEAQRQAINSPVQSFGSDILLMSAIEINATMPECQIVALIHDSLLIEVDKDIAEEAALKIKAIMENPKLLTEVFVFTPTVPLIAEYALGAWGSK